MSPKKLVPLLGAALLMGCSHEEMACALPGNVTAAEKAFAEHIHGLLSDVSLLKQNIPGLQRFGNDAAIGKLIEGFTLPDLKLSAVEEEERHGFGARTCTGRMSVAFLGTEQEHALRYDVARSGWFSDVEFRFPEPAAATTAFQVVDEALKAKRRVDSLARFTQQVEQARAAGFDDPRAYERQQVFQTRRLILESEQQRIELEMTETLNSLENSKADLKGLTEELATAEKANEGFLVALESGRHLGLGSQNIEIREIDLEFSGSSSEPLVNLLVRNIGDVTLAGATLEISLYLDGSKDAFLVSGDAAQTGRFVLRFREPSLSPGQTAQVVALRTGLAEGWQAPEVMAAKRRQLVVRVTDTLTAGGASFRSDNAVAASVSLAALKLRKDQIAKTTAVLEARLAELKAAQGRVAAELGQLRSADIGA